MSYYAGSCDVAVIGAGHAGIEAALAAARLGNHTILFTINLDAVGNMPCNPAIGGTGKGHLVRELDALGGEMGAAADHACIQYRMLNRGKGPAVHSLRAQADRRKYQQVMKHTLERQEHLTLRQGEVVALRTEDGSVQQVVLTNVQFPKLSKKQDYGTTNGVSRADQLKADIAALQDRLSGKVTLWFSYTLDQCKNSSVALDVPALTLGVQNLLVTSDAAMDADALQALETAATDAGVENLTVHAADRFETDRVSG